MRSIFNVTLCLIAVLTIWLTPVFGQPADSTQNMVTLTNDYYHFDKQFSRNWYVGSLEYKRQLSWTTLLGRISYGSRLEKRGWQIEAEAYPRFSKKTYGYINVGYSGDAPVFPGFRAGASFFANLPGGWEVEGGVRHLYFDKAVWVSTGGISKYAGQWLFNVRTFVSKGNQSFFINSRRYFKNDESYVWMLLGSGISPDETRNVQLKESVKLSSRRVAVGLKHLLFQKHLFLISLGYSNDEYLPGIYGNQIFGAAGYGIKF